MHGLKNVACMQTLTVTENKTSCLFAVAFQTSSSLHVFVVNSNPLGISPFCVFELLWLDTNSNGGGSVHIRSRNRSKLAMPRPQVKLNHSRSGRRAGETAPNISSSMGPNFVKLAARVWSGCTRTQEREDFPHILLLKTGFPKGTALNKKRPNGLPQTPYERGNGALSAPGLAAIVARRFPQSFEGCWQ